MSSAVLKLAPGIQSYDWGKKGSSSLAAQLGAVCVTDFKVDEKKTYAELWMGTHPTLPSYIQSDKSLLSEHLKSDHKLIGERIIAKFPDSEDGSLPFLFKVLSIGTALSIQAHPDKPLAKRLFTERGDIYKDPNHKPEMAIALTPFLAFLNFLPLPELLVNLKTVAELAPIISKDLVSALESSLQGSNGVSSKDQATPTDEQKKALKAIFGALMSSPDDLVKKQIASLVQRYEAGNDIAENEKGLVKLTLTLNQQYPGDVGVLCVFMLNVVELKAGEAAFLGANVPHAYLEGDIIECMATSDNVVRAGLTPKLRDVPTLVEMLTYEAGPGSAQLLKPTPFPPSLVSDDKTTLYDPPITEFSVLRVALPKGEGTQHRAIDGPSLVIVTKGEGQVASGSEEVLVARGDVLFISAGQEVQWKSTQEDLEVFRAFVEA